TPLRQRPWFGRLLPPWWRWPCLRVSVASQRLSASWLFLLPGPFPSLRSTALCVPALRFLPFRGGAGTPLSVHPRSSPPPFSRLRPEGRRRQFGQPILSFLQLM